MIMDAKLQDRDLESLWGKYTKLASKVMRPGVNELVTSLGERIITCSASTDVHNPGCGPGGLVETTLDVTRRMSQLSKSLEVTVPTESLILVGLFHNVGMVGDLATPYLVEQKSNWHIERGNMYTYHDKIAKMPVAHRSLFLLQSFGVQLDYDEWTTIMLSSGLHREENRFYGGHEPNLAILLTQARQWLGRAS